jgi:hypothetical protein
MNGVSHKVSGSGFELSESVHRLPALVVCVQSYKKDSPISGLFRVKVYNKNGMAQRNGIGMFPREVMNRFPLQPLEEEGRLNDMLLRENFIERVFAYYRWTEMLDEEPTAPSTTPRWVASSPMPASGTGMNSPPSTELCSWRA